MAKGICNLCGEENDLLSKSHIIPDCMYQELYDEKHKIHKFEPVSYFKGESYMQKPSSGEYEGGLLCAKCDNERIGRLESYACHFLYSTGELPEDIKPAVKNFRDEPTGVGFSTIGNTKYDLFKLFILSILWRAGISKREGFGQIVLEDDEPIIREMLLTNNPKSEDVYPIVFFGWIQGDSLATDMIQQPVTVKEKHGKRYMFPINGLVYNIYTSIEDIKPELQPHILKENGEFTIFNLGRDLFERFIKKYHGI